MPAFTQPQRGLTVVLCCDGHDPFEVTARDPAHAAVVALGLISARGALNAGDTLSCTELTTRDRSCRRRRGHPITRNHVHHQ
jgi:hypothetical protein